MTQPGLSPATSSFNDAGNWSSGSVRPDRDVRRLEHHHRRGGFAGDAGESSSCRSAGLYLERQRRCDVTAAASQRRRQRATIDVTGGATLATTSTSRDVRVNLNGGGLGFGGNSNNPGLALSLGANGGTLDTNCNSLPCRRRSMASAPWSSRAAGRSGSPE